MHRPGFGLLVSHNFNLGDDIQSLAARNHLPRVDALIDRENLPAARSAGPLKIIMNGWFMYRTDRWPPPPNLLPLFLSLHIDRKERLSVMDIIHRKLSAWHREHPASLRHRDYLAGVQPIGCRDLATLDAVRELGLSAYFSGCLTLTLPRTKTRPAAGGPVTFVDPFGRFAPPGLRQALWRKVPRALRRGAVKVSHFSTDRSVTTRMQRAQELLDLYQRSSLVVTSRLHCALPCLAFGTPVIFVQAGHRPRRFLGYDGLLRSVRSAQLHEKDGFERAMLAASEPVDVTGLAGALKRSCREFVES